MRKLAATVLGISLLFAALGLAQTAMAHARADAGPPQSRGIADLPAAPDTEAGSVWLRSSASSCESGDCACACCTSCPASAGCAGHAAALAGSPEDVEHRRAVAQYVWLSPSLSFLVPADTEPPRAGA